MEPREVGGKAYGLLRASAIAAVPHFKIVGSSLFRGMLAAHQLSSVYEAFLTLGGDDPDEQSLRADLEGALVRGLLTLELPPTILNAIGDAYTATSIYASDAGIVARSSATVEDGGAASWAGQFHSVFGIQTLSGAISAVRSVWVSAVRARGRAVGPVPSSFATAVIFQPAIRAVASGVAVTILGPSPSFLTETTPGLLGPLVEGRVSPERWVSGAPGGRCRLLGRVA